MNKLEAYKEPRKLTNRERAFCENAKHGYLARDKNGIIIFNTDKPKKTNCSWVCVSDININCLSHQHLFSFIKWEDEEPYSIEKMLTWEVESEVK